jgi:hypothetical protein
MFEDLKNIAVEFIRMYSPLSVNLLITSNMLSMGSDDCIPDIEEGVMDSSIIFERYV